MKALLAAVVMAGTAFCQAPADRPEFEVASVKVAEPLTGQAQFNVGVHIDGAMVRCNYLTLRNLLMMAYDVKDYQITGPDWLTTEHYDLVAKVPTGVSLDKNLRGMVRSLLEDRFKLTLHRETKGLPAYVLVLGKGPLRLKEIPPNAETDDADKGKVDVNVASGRSSTVVNLGKGSYITYGLNKLEAKKVPILALLDSLARFVDRPIVDMTELKGNYDFTLEYSVEELKSLVRSQGGDPSHIPDLGGDPTISVFSSLESLGLKLDARKAPLEVLVIDHAERTPTAN